jgi:O-Antigen ligase
VRRQLDLRALRGNATLVLCGLCLLISIALVSSQGGYFAPSWGWSALIALGAVAFAAFAGTRTDGGWTDVVFIGALAALVAWIGLSIAWSSNPAASVQELERAGVYLGAVGAFLLLAHRSLLRQVVPVFQAGITIVAAYALATRLFPLHVGTYDGFAGYRLAGSVGYWNGLAIFCVLGILLALGIFLSETRATVRVVAAGSLVVLAPTAYFTFSRGGWLALGVGLAVWFVVAPRRLQSVGLVAIVAALPAAAVALAAGSSALTHRYAGAHAAESAGGRLAVWLALLLLAQIAVGIGVGEAAKVPIVRRRLAPALGAAVVLATLAAVVAALVHYGGPVEAARRGYHAFQARPSPVEGNLNKRLFSLSSNGRSDLWRGAVTLYENHSALGAGAGSFDRFWLADRKATLIAHDAHNLYLETLAELGPIGLGILAVFLLVPFYAVARHRNALSAGAFAAFAAYLAHATVDWDWELSGVTASALLCAAIVIVAARRRERPVELPAVPRAAVVAASVACFAGACVGWIGNEALSRAESARDEGRYAQAISDADTARRWMPWSARPRVVAGESYLLLGARPQARTVLRRALRQDDRDWEAWLALSRVTSGAESRRALARAGSLNRLDPSVQALEHTATTEASK